MPSDASRAPLLQERIDTLRTTIKTKHGEREVLQISGGVTDVFMELLGPNRLVVESKNESRYKVVAAFGPGNSRVIVAKIADKLGLEIVRARRRCPAYAIRTANEGRTDIEQFKTRRKWPDVKLRGWPLASFSNGVVYRDNVRARGDKAEGTGRLLFDGVSLDELAQFFEDSLEGSFGGPVVNVTGDARLYSFTLPDNSIWKTFSKEKPASLPGLALSVAFEKPEIDVTLVRDHRAGTNVEWARDFVTNGATRIFQRDDRLGFLRIDRLPFDSQNLAYFTVVTTARGEIELRALRAHCRSVLYRLAPQPSRLIFETKDQALYEAVCDWKNPRLKTAEEVANGLGLEIVHDRRRSLALVIRANDEKPVRRELFDGRSKWPGLREPGSGFIERMKCSDGGIYSRSDAKGVHDETVYFDGVSLDEVAMFFENEFELPVVNDTGDKRRYSFTLPKVSWDRQDKWRSDPTSPYNWDGLVWKSDSYSFGGPFLRFNLGKAMPLGGLGLSVVCAEPEIDMLVVRDKPAAGAASLGRERGP